MKNFKDIEKIQKGIFSYMKKKALSFEGKPSSDLKSYRNSQTRYAKRPFKKVLFKDLMLAIEKANTIYIGDFHSFDQNTRNLERILRRLISKKKQKITLAVEFVQQEHQEYVDQYLNRLISEMEFLEHINYRDSWRFPWVHYRKFFQMAKQHRFKIVALNSRGTLKERDHKAAVKIVDNLLSYPDSKIIVLFGELHIIPSKLPKEVEKISMFKVRQTIIHQNLDQVFWKLERKNSKDPNSIVKFNKNEFSLQTSPPWIKYESMIYWYENLCDDPEFDIHEYIMETGVMKFNSTVFDNFVFTCEKVLSSLKIKIDKQKLEEFNLYDHEHLSTIIRKIRSKKYKNFETYYQKLITRGRSFHLSGSNYYYCSNYSMNRISYIAGIHIRNIIIEKGYSEYSLINLQENIERFIYITSQNAFAYVCSKIINPYRKCDRYKDLVALGKTQKNSTSRLNTERTIQILELSRGQESELVETLKHCSLNSIHSIGRRIGYFLGEELFDNFLRHDGKKFQEYSEMLLRPISEKEFLWLLRKVIPSGELKKTKKRFF